MASSSAKFCLKTRTVPAPSSQPLHRRAILTQQPVARHHHQQQHMEQQQPVTQQPVARHLLVRIMVLHMGAMHRVQRVPTLLVLPVLLSLVLRVILP
jgi:hypothetical protein